MQRPDIYIYPLQNEFVLEYYSLETILSLTFYLVSLGLLFSYYVCTSLVVNILVVVFCLGSMVVKKTRKLQIRWIILQISGRGLFDVDHYLFYTVKPVYTEPSICVQNRQVFILYRLTNISYIVTLFEIRLYRILFYIKVLVH